MRLVELLNLANRAYQDGYMAHYYDQDGQLVEGSGDTLAKFVVLEIDETYEPDATDEEQLRTARQTLVHAIDDLKAIVRELGGAGEL